MSTKAYSKDLRSKVINHLKVDSSQIKASQLFNVSKSTVSRWWITFTEEKRIEPKPRGGSKNKVSLEDIGKFVENNPDKTLKLIGEHFGISGTACYKKLKKLGYSYKKNLYLAGSESR